MLIREKLKKRDSFSELECQLADYILEHEDEIEDLSVRKLGTLLYVSPPSIIRFCKKIGFEGYAEFRKNWLDEVHCLRSHFQQVDANFPFQEKDTDFEAAAKLAALYRETVDDTLETLDPENLTKAAGLLSQAERVIIIGNGANEDLAHIIEGRLIAINKMAVVPHNLTETGYMANFCTRKDCFLFISYSGETASLVQLAGMVKGRDVPVIVLSFQGQSSLSNLADACLSICTREKLRGNLGSFSSTLSVLYLLDVLYACIFKKDYTGNYVRRTHPELPSDISRLSEDERLKDI